MSIYRLTQGPGGMIYGSTFINQHFFRCDPETGRLEDLGRIVRSGGQCDSMCLSRDGNRLWMGSYTNARVSVYDPSLPYKLGGEADCNPRDFGPVGGGQYRTQAIVEGPLGKVYCGTVPSYNSAPTGALAILDPQTLRKEVKTDLVPGGAVSCLAADDESVFGAGGGRLFILNPETGTMTQERELACTALLIGPDGTLVAATPQDVQGLDPRTLETRWTVPLSEIEGLKGIRRLVADPAGELYGISDLGIIRIDPVNGTLARRTESGSSELAVDGSGRLYFAQGASLYLYDPQGQ